MSKQNILIPTTMNYTETEKKVKYLYELIQSGYKANPRGFASKLNLPLRSYYRILSIVKMKYGDVKYDRRALQYYFIDEN